MNKDEILACFIDDLQRENMKHNLISRQATREDLERHVVDCTAVNEIYAFDGFRTVDIGTGGGISGISAGNNVGKGTFHAFGIRYEKE